MTAGVGTRAARAGRVKLVLTVVGAVVGFGANVALARLLGPDVFGAMAFALVVVGLARTLSTVRSDAYVVYLPDEAEAQQAARTLFGAEVLLAALVGGALAAAAGPLMAALGRPDLVAVVRGLSVLVVLSPLTVLQARFVRNLDFVRGHGPATAGTVVKAATAVTLAAGGLGVWALVWGEVVSVAVVAALFLVLSGRGALPGFERRHLAGALRYGLPLTGTALLAFYYWNVDDYMVGRILTLEALGLYWLAFRLPHQLMQVSGLASSVAFPAFARAWNTDAIAPAFVRLTRATAWLMLLPLLISTLFGAELIEAVYGAQWLGATLPFQLFMALVCIRAIFNYWADVYQAAGRTAPLLGLTAVNAVLITVLGIPLVTRYGVVGMAVAVLLTISTTVFVGTRYLKRLLDVRYADALMRPVAALALCLGVGGLLKGVVAGPLGEAALAVGMVAAWGVLAWALDRTELTAAWAYVRGAA
ncbi:MAG: oligosaccharide flippase family protein [Longimicrobiales bacterium]